MMCAREIVRSLLEADEVDPEAVDPEHYIERYSDAILADEARGTVTYRKAMENDVFWHRTVTYAGRSKKPGGPYAARRNGATKTWKTRPGEFRVPIKIGFKGYGYIDQNNADQWSTRPDFKEAWEEYAEKTQQAKQAAEIKAGQEQPLKPSSQGTLPIQARDPKQPELFNERRSRLREFGVY
jgi:hypothetical protein